MMPRRGCCLWQSRFQSKGLELLKAKLGYGRGRGAAGEVGAAAAGRQGRQAAAGLGHAASTEKSRSERSLWAWHEGGGGKVWRAGGCARCGLPAAIAAPLPGERGPGGSRNSSAAASSGNRGPGPAGRFREFSLPFQAWQRARPVT